MALYNVEYKPLLSKLIVEIIKEATQHHQLTYQELAAKVGVHHRALEHRLPEVVKICGALRYPPLPVLVVNKRTGEPGGGFYNIVKDTPGFEGITEDNEVEYLGHLRDAVWNVSGWKSLLDWMEIDAKEAGLEEERSDDDVPEHLAGANGVAPGAAATVGALVGTSGIDVADIRKRALAANLYPKVSHTSTVQYARDPRVTEYAKARANGFCQLCGQRAPFDDRNHEPFLEVHHIEWLSKGGQDSVRNVAALCPNCHRKMHIVQDPADIAKLRQAAIEDV